MFDATEIFSESKEWTVDMLDLHNLAWTIREAIRNGATVEDVREFCVCVLTGNLESETWRFHG